MTREVLNPIIDECKQLIKIFKERKDKTSNPGYTRKLDEIVGYIQTGQRVLESLQEFGDKEDIGKFGQYPEFVRKEIVKATEIIEDERELNPGKFWNNTATMIWSINSDLGIFARKEFFAPATDEEYEEGRGHTDSSSPQVKVG